MIDKFRAPIKKLMKENVLRIQEAATDLNLEQKIHFLLKFHQNLKWLLNISFQVIIVSR